MDGSLFDLSGRTAVVVGAGSGIGRACSLALSDAGADLVCADVDGKAAQATAEELAGRGATASAHETDVTDEASVQTLARETPRVDVAVVTAGVHARTPVTAMTDEQYARVIDVNLTGTFRTLRAFGRTMEQARRGSIIAFASIRASVVEPGQSAYAASKAGVVQLVRSLAAELGPVGVRVNAVAPAYVETPLTGHIRDFDDWHAAIAEKTALGRWAQPAEIAAPVVFLASDAASYITGSCLMVDGGWTAIDGRFVQPFAS